MAALFVRQTSTSLLIVRGTGVSGTLGTPWRRRQSSRSVLARHRTWTMRGVLFPSRPAAIADTRLTLGQRCSRQRCVDELPLCTPYGVNQVAQSYMRTFLRFALIACNRHARFAPQAAEKDTGNGSCVSALPYRTPERYHGLAGTSCRMSSDRAKSVVMREAECGPVLPHEAVENGSVMGL